MVVACSHTVFGLRQLLSNLLKLEARNTDNLFTIVGINRSFQKLFVIAIGTLQIYSDI
jgi:hypothetical protein